MTERGKLTRGNFRHTNGGISSSATWIPRGLSCVCAQREESNNRLDLTPCQVDCLRKLQQRIDVTYDSSIPKHREALGSLWRAAFPDRELTGLISEQWKEMGWQGKNPCTDFRGGGFISLENLLFLAANFPVSINQLPLSGDDILRQKCFRDLLEKRNGDRSDWEYPFAVAGVNITFMLIQMLHLSSANPLSIIRSFFVKMMAENEAAFDILYCIAFKLLDDQWLAMGATYLDFNIVLKSIRRHLETELLREEIRCIDQLPSYSVLTQ